MGIKQEEVSFRLMPVVELKTKKSIKFKQYVGREQQQGFSLIELMIATLIGIFLIGGMIAVFTTTSQNYRVQQALTEIQNKGRFSLKKIRQDLQLAGFERIWDLQALEVFTSNIALESAVSTNIDANTEILQIYYNDSGTTRTLSYYVENTVLLRHMSPAIAGQQNPLQIIDRVNGLQFSFAVDLGNGLVKVGGNSYLTEANISDADVVGATVANWQKVKAVKVDILVSSDTPNVVDNIQVNAAPFAAIVPTDNRLYQVFRNTNSLRNRLE